MSQQFKNEAKEIGSEVGQMISLAIASGIKGGAAFLFLKFAYGIYHDYGVSGSLSTLFTPYGLIVFGIGFFTGAFLFF